MPDSSSLRKGFYIAIKALRRNKLQTTLTMVGMTIGVATVLSMFALGTGAQAAIQDQVRAAGMNVILVTSGNYKMAQQWTNQGEAEEPNAALEPAPLAAPPALTPAKYDPAHPARLLRIQSGNPTRRLEREGQNAAGRGAADTLTLADADAIAAIPGVQYVSGGVYENITVKSGDASSNPATWFTKLHGEGEDIPSIRRAWIFPHGHFFSRSDVKNAAPVAVLGSIVAKKLFGDENPVGKTISLHGRDCRIVGIIASGSWMVPASEGDDQFDAIYIPVTFAQQLLDRKSLNLLTLSTKSTGDVTRVTKDITTLLRQRHNIPAQLANDFEVASQAHKSLSKGGMRTDIARAVVGNVNNLDKVTLDQLGKTLDQASRTMTALLGSIAAVSLIVGGIGIMNIMLLSVTERTKEIGIRRAVGARSSEVMMQFLLEAVTLSLGGGLLGILAGIAASSSITRLVQWSTTISPLAVALSFGVSAAVGILFGYYPAQEASRVTPMTSLRYE